MDIDRLKGDRARSDILKRSRNNVVGSKMKMERLRTMLQNLKDGERQSKMRNETLLQDFDKVNKLANNLDTKARKLKKVKQEYENYINTVYPQWKENIENCRVTKSSHEELDFERDQMMHSFREQDPRNSKLLPLHSTSRNYENESHFSNRAHDKSNDRSYYSQQASSNRSDNLIDTRTQTNFAFSNQLPTVRDEPVNLMSASNQPNQYLPSFHDRSRNINNHQAAIIDHNGLGNSLYTTNFKPSRPDFLGIPRVQEGADISSFTILPQALALSPDGRLVLLPMAFSPEMKNPGYYRTSSDSPKRNSEMKDTVVDRRDENYNEMDVRGGQNSRNSFDQTPMQAVKSEMPFEVVQSFPDSRIKQRKSHDTVNDYDGKDISRVGALDTFRIDDGQTPRTMAPGNKENVLKDTTTNLNECRLFQSAVAGKQEIDSNIYENSKGARNDQIEELKSVSEPMAEKQGRNIEASNIKEQELLVNEHAREELDVKPSSNIDDVSKKQPESDRVLVDEELKDIMNKGSIEEIFTSKPLTNQERNVSFDTNSDVEFDTNDSNKLIGINDNDQAKVDADFIVSTRETAVFASKEMNETEVPEDIANGNGDNMLKVGEKERSIEGQGSNVDGAISGKVVDAKTEQKDILTDNVTEKKSDYPSKMHGDALQAVSKDEPVNKPKKELTLDIPEISYLFEEIENRMEKFDRKEFYRKALEDTSDEVLDRIKQMLILQGNLDDFETSDLCILSKLSVTDFVNSNSKDGCILKTDADLSTIYTLDGFREILLIEYEELWEYIFNHMELLTANEIFESPTVCGIFSKMLCTRNEAISFEISQTIQRIMDGTDDDVIYEDEQDYEETDSVGNASHDDENDPSEQRDDEIEGKRTILSPAYSIETATSSNSMGNEALPKSPGAQKHNESVEKKKASNETGKEKSDLSLDLGSLSNDNDEDYDDDDDDSTFDSAKLTPHRTAEILGERNNVAKSDENTVEDETLSDKSSEGMPGDVTPEKMREELNEVPLDEDNESDDDLEDMLSTSLVLDGNKNKIDLPKYEPSAISNKKEEKKPPLLFTKKLDSFEIDDGKPLQNSNDFSEQQGILSPQHSKSISSKFRKPGFWEHSDTESEMDEVNISAGNNKSAQNDNEDEFDFDFYS